MSEMNRYSFSGSEKFESKIHQTVQEMGSRLGQAFGPQCVAIVLGGGYGRGEGACIVKEGKEYLYNDFDLFVITTKKMEIPQKVKEVAHGYEQSLGIEVDIGKPIPMDSLPSLPHELMWQDLLDGYTVIFGDGQHVAKAKTKRMMEPLPKVEAIHLLLNRGTGLLQAIREAYLMEIKTSHNLPDQDFIRRNYQKCALALGDALLIALGMYRPPLAYRREKIESLQDPGLYEILSIQSSYREAAEFKVKPGIAGSQPTLDRLVHMAKLWISLFLWIEEERKGKHWHRIEDYAQDHFIREPSQHRLGKIPRNVVKQLKNGKISWRYPREPLYGELGLLLDTIKPGQEDWQTKTESFLHVWRTCN